MQPEFFILSKKYIMYLICETCTIYAFQSLILSLFAVSFAWIYNFNILDRAWVPCSMKDIAESDEQSSDHGWLSSEKIQIKLNSLYIFCAKCSFSIMMIIMNLENEHAGHRQYTTSWRCPCLTLFLKKALKLEAHREPVRTQIATSGEGLLASSAKRSQIELPKT